MHGLTLIAAGFFPHLVFNMEDRLDWLSLFSLLLLPVPLPHRVVAELGLLGQLSHLLFLPLGVVGGVELFQNLSLTTVLAISPHRILGNLLPLFGVDGAALLVSVAQGFLHLQLACVG